MKSSSRLLLMAICLVVGSAFGVWFSDRSGIQAQSGVRPVPVVSKDLYTFRDIVKTTAPAVVSIEAKAKPKLRSDLAEPSDLVLTQAQPPEVQLGFGSGVIVDPNGVILTNNHVVEGAESLEIRLPDGRRFVSRDWRTDRKTDLAIIRIPSDKPLPFLPFGDSDQMEVGDRVLAIGAPFGLTGSVTHGIISAKSRNLRLNQYEDFVQTDAAINPGNSGGPLINLEGQIIGINSAIKSKSGGFQGIGLAISSNLAKTIMTQLLKDGTVKRGYLGVQIHDIDAKLATQFGLKEGSGVVITKVFDQSPAFKSGLKLNDVVQTINGKPVRDGIELQKVVAGLPLYQPVDVVLQRDGRSVMLKLTIEEQPEEFGTK